MQKEESDLRDRSKDFALQIIPMFVALPKSTEAQLLENQFRRLIGIGCYHSCRKQLGSWLENRLCESVFGRSLNRPKVHSVAKQIPGVVEKGLFCQNDVSRLDFRLHARAGSAENNPFRLKFITQYAI